MSAFDLVHNYLLEKQGIDLDYWGEWKPLPVSDWKYEVANNDTRQGYWDWVQSRLDGCTHDNAVLSDDNEPATYHCPDCGQNIILASPSVLNRE